MKIENKQNAIRLPMEIAELQLPYMVIKVLNGAEVVHNFENKKDLVAINFDGKQELLHIDDFFIVKMTAEHIYNNWVCAKDIQSSYQTLSNTLEIHRKAYEKISSHYRNAQEGKTRMVCIKGDDSGCGYWRMVLPARSLDDKDYVLDISTIEIVYEMLECYDIVYVQRVCSWNAFYVIQKLKKAGKKIVYDIDDNLFELPDYHPSKKYFGNDERESAGAIMSISDVIVTTTTHMRDLLIRFVGEEIGDKIQIVPNAINLDSFSKKTVYPNCSSSPKRPFRIMWGGSATHEVDFKTVVGAIDRFLLNHKDVDIRLLIMGYLPMCVREMSAKEHWQEKIEYASFSDIETYFAQLPKAQVDLAIAPLVDDSFNVCKSNIKWIEYTLAGVPVVASNVAPYSDTIEHGIDGLIATTEDEWLEIFEDKFKNRKDPKWQGYVNNAWDKIEENYSIKKTIPVWKEIFTI